MKVSCDIITDLLPLYHDGVCSENSRKMVEEHLSECESCRDVLEKIRNSTVDNFLERERNDVVGHHTQAVKRKSLVAGISMAAIMAVPILICLIVNLATGHALDWFFIVLTSLMTLASVTVVPMVVEKEKGLWTLGSFTVSLTLLLLTCAIYSGGDWFFVAIVPILFGLSLMFTPYVMGKLSLAGFAARNKGLLAMAIDTLLLYAVIVVSGLYTNGGSEYWQSALTVTSVCLLFPWGLFLIIRYVKSNAFVRAGLSTIFSGLYFSYGLSLIDWLVKWITNESSSGITFGIAPYRFSGANLSVWNDATINPNVFLTILLASCIVGGFLIAAGLLWKNRSR